MKEYQSKSQQTNEVREKIEKAKDIAEKIIREKQEKVLELNKQRDEFRSDLRKI